ncbi:hypothetical protein MMC21_003667 [Puttea exsequens]|nr:hypothetical protein [Puttea exsequens]
MPIADIDSRLRFLDAAAHLYSCTSPELSAHLMLQRNSAATNRPEEARKSDDGDSCKGCGIVLVPGRTSRKSIIHRGLSSKASTTRKVKGRILKSIQPNDKYVRTSCLRCHRFEDAFLNSTKALRPGKPASKDRVSVPNERSGPDAANLLHEDPLKPATANASSKQRAKARKQGGLQAMLEKSKASAGSPSGLGLDLSVLMKPS